MASKWWVLAIFAIGVSTVACGEKSIRLDPMVVSTLSAQKEVVAIHYLPEEFTAKTPEVRNAGNAGMMFGAIGGAIAGAAQTSAAKEAGRQLVTDYGLEDPILRVKKSFLGWATSGGYVRHVRQEPQAHSENIDRLKKTFSTEYMFDFKTTGWSLGPAGVMSQDNYNVRYEGRARLLSFPEGKIEWQGICSAEGKTDAPPPTLLRLVAKSGAILKELLESAADACVEQLKNGFSG